MRIVFSGAGKVSIETAKGLIKKGHEVILIETDKDKIDELSDEMDCSFIHGDGSQPNLLREVNPVQTDFLFCLTDSDQDNVIGSLVGRSLGFKRIVTSVSDPQFENICIELGLKDIISPSRTISGYLEDMVEGSEHSEVSTAIKFDARLFIFIVKDKDALFIKDLDLPDNAKVICYYRNDEFHFPDEKTNFCPGDEVIILTHSENMRALEKRWHSPQDQNNKKTNLEV